VQGQLPIGRPRREPRAKSDEPIVARNDVVILVSEEEQNASDGAGDDRTHGMLLPAPPALARGSGVGSAMTVPSLLRSAMPLS